jgi:hypothetical protein
MTFTQPPVTSVAVFVGTSRSENDLPRTPDYEVVRNNQGVTLGDIFDNVRGRATTPYLREAPFCIAILTLASYERVYSANYLAFFRYKGSSKG